MNQPVAGGSWLVTGARGMLGRAVLAALDASRVPALAAGRAELDLTDRASVHAYVMAHRPAVVVNCAAWTAVDDAESREPEALAVNGTGAGLLAEACAAAGSLLLHMSTDYVFGGDDGTLPYAEDAPPGPRSAYGRTKLAGELAVRAALPDTGYVVRTAWLYGAGGKNFVATMLRLERERETLDVVNDQWGQPTWAADLAGQLVLLGRAALVGAAPAGVYHGTSGGRTTWCAFAREIFRLAGADPDRVRPTTSAAYPTVAHRPAHSVLGHDRWRAAGIDPIRDWRTALAAALPGLNVSV
ncbi:dTDP-4-dehydrorhamnose reductase [Streptomyces sp. NPDC021093]|uniref:dTDP-4-dehydrorhamnose reductase n=1 Tax=Streptomyces sp. NPDC021093 TaxID=3365112 RepID=UPI0037B945E4